MIVYCFELEMPPLHTHTHLHLDATFMAVLQGGAIFKGYFNLQKVLDFYCLKKSLW